MASAPPIALSDSLVDMVAWHNALRKTQGKCQQIVANYPSGSQLKWLIMGDSLGARKAKFIWPQLREALGCAGIITPVYASIFSEVLTGGTPTVTAPATDYTKTPTGGYTTLASSGQSIGCKLDNTNSDSFPFSRRVCVPGVLSANRIKVYYTPKRAARGRLTCK
jgi:hypothetical protein